ncbi:hypothetical protein GCM10027418_06590 [Mariniluteicoccus endophyticus]
MAAYVVTAAAVRVVVGASALIVEQGNRLPEGVSQDELERLVEKQMVSELADGEIATLDVDKLVVTGEGDKPTPDEGDEPEKSIDDMNLAELRAYAEEHAIDLGGATRKPEVVEAIKAAQA